MIKQRIGRCLRIHGASLLVILVGCIVTYLAVFDPVLYMDDWHFIEKFVFHHMPFIDWASRRPLENLGFWFLLDIFRLNLRGLFLAQVATQYLCAVSVYFLTRRLFPTLSFLALPVGLLFLVYPVDYTRMWFTQVYTWMIYAATLLALYLLVDYAGKGGLWRMAAALALITFPLFAYEAQYGLVAAGCVLAACFLKNAPIKRRLAILSPLVVGALFAIWRVLLQPRFLRVFDPYMDSLHFEPLILLKRFFAVFEIFTFGWIKPFTQFLPGISAFKLLFILGCMVLFFVLFAVVFQVGELSEHISREERRYSLKNLGAASAVGLILLLAGYLPIIFFADPNLRSTGPTSRFNLFAIYGASLLLVAMIGLFASCFIKTRPQLLTVVYAAVVALFLVGAFQQVWIQNESRMAWRKQQFFWRNLFVTLPDLEDGTTLVVVQRGAYPPEPFRRLPFIAEWEVDDGLRVLYNNPHLQGTVYFPDFKTGAKSQTCLEPDGVHGYDVKFVPYRDVVIIQYTPWNDEIKIVRDPNYELDLPFPVPDYNPDKRILRSPPSDTPFRTLIFSHR